MTATMAENRVCYDCYEPATPGRSRCVKHLVMAAANAKRYWQARKSRKDNEPKPEHAAIHTVT